MRYIEEEGRTVEEALEKALEKAGIDRNEARFEVLNEGLGEKPARVRLYLDTEDMDLIENLIREFIGILGTRIDVEIEPRKKGYYVNIHTRGYDSALIGKGGKTLEALDYLINLMLRRKKPNIQVELDISRYRERRREFLRNKALAVARRVKETGKEMRIDPLTPEERKLVRETLKKDRSIKVYQVGRGEEATLVVAPVKRE